MARSSPEKLAAALRENLKRRKPPKPAPEPKPGAESVSGRPAESAQKPLKNKE